MDAHQSFLQLSKCNSNSEILCDATLETGSPIKIPQTSSPMSSLVMCQSPPLTFDATIRPHESLNLHQQQQHTTLQDALNEKSIYNYEVLNCYCEPYDLKQHTGHPLIITNIAVKCKEYSEKCLRLLNTLYSRYHSRGFTVLGFPCDQFSTAEPLHEDELVDLVPLLYSSIGTLEFPILGKVDVNGAHEHPLFTYLKSCVKGTLGQTAVKWNFSYFLIDMYGIPVARFEAETPQRVLEDSIIELLNETGYASPLSEPLGGSDVYCKKGNGLLSDNDINNPIDVPNFVSCTQASCFTDVIANPHLPKSSSGCLPIGALNTTGVKPEDDDTP